jgi:hypothetical protein
VSHDDLTIAEMVANLTTKERAAPLTMGAFADFVEAVDQRIRDLERRLAVNEAKALTYRGAFTRAACYERNDLVTHAGQLWFATAATNEPPGKSLDWLLTAKAQGR